MLIVHAQNVTPGNGTAADGTADYIVTVKINFREIWHGRVAGHRRAEGAAVLLRKIADYMDGSVQGQDRAATHHDKEIPPGTHSW